MVDVRVTVGNVLGPCRLPYELWDENKKIDHGYLLSPKDVCSLDMLPSFIDAGVTSLKIEGRMKTPEYVATVTRIYRKYIDLYLQNKPYQIEEQDKKDLLQVFNRGGFSSGHLLNEANHQLIFKEKPNNMGIPIGTVSHYNENKGHITLSLIDHLSIGDTISFELEPSCYTVSELMQNNQNLSTASAKQTVKIRSYERKYSYW